MHEIRAARRFIQGFHGGPVKAVAEAGPALSPDGAGLWGVRLYAKRLLTYDPAMTQDQVKEVLDRVLTWPPERQQDAAQLLLQLEAREGELYHPDDEEWAAIEEGLAQAKRGEFVSADEIAALLKLGGR